MPKLSEQAENIQLQLSRASASIIKFQWTRGKGDLNCIVQTSVTVGIPTIDVAGLEGFPPQEFIDSYSVGCSVARPASQPASLPVSQLPANVVASS